MKYFLWNEFADIGENMPLIKTLAQRGYDSELVYLADVIDDMGLLGDYEQYPEETLDLLGVEPYIPTTGMKLAGIWDTVDGPVALYVRRVGSRE